MIWIKINTGNSFHYFDKVLNFFMTLSFHGTHDQKNDINFPVLNHLKVILLPVIHSYYRIIDCNRIYQIHDFIIENAFAYFKFLSTWQATIRYSKNILTLYPTNYGRFAGAKCTDRYDG